MVGRSVIARWSVLAAAIVALTGCAGAGVRRSPPAAPESVRLNNVPFFPDGTDQCGPSTLASLLTFWNRPTSPAELKKEIYLPQVRGTLPMDLLPAVEDRGLAGAVSQGSVEDLRQNLRAGRPVLAYLDLGNRLMSWGHYVVVTGFNENGFFAHSGKKKDQFMSTARFEKVWDRTDRWMLVVTGPKERPS